MERRGGWRREGRGFRGGGGRWRGGGNSGGRGRRGGHGGWRGGGGGRTGGRGRLGGRGGIDHRDRRPAEPTADTLALMGTQAQESTVGITRFISEDVPSFSGVLKQRFSDFIVHEVGPDGDLCKGTDFPGLLRPVENTPSANATVAAASAPEPPTGADTTKPAAANCDKDSGQKRDGGVVLEGSVGGGREGVEEQGKEVEKDDAMGGDGDLGRESQREEEEARERECRKKEEVEKVKQFIKEGMQSLLPVLGEDVTAKVEAFILEGVITKGRDKRTLTLPSTNKGTRTKVYRLLKKHLSRYLLAVTVDDPACVNSVTTEKSEAHEDANVESSKGGGEDDGDVAVPPVEAGNGVGAASDSTGGGNIQGGVSKAIPGGESEGDMTKSPRPDPHGPKCVQLKMNPGWRGKGGVNGKRRRGNLADGQAEGVRWGWPADRPEFCRFVLYKENCDTMGAVVRFCKHFRFSSMLVQYAGTKDKRGCTSQWCTVKKKSDEELKTFNRPLGAFKGPMVLLGNFSYVTEPLKLGALSGNRFGIVLRNVALPRAASPSGQEGEREGEDHAQTGADDQTDDPVATGEDDRSEGGAVPTNVLEEVKSKAEAVVRLKETIDRRCARVKERGFINYFGLQRFGTGGAPTSEVGLAMLKEDWEGAVRLVMAPRIGENEATHASKVHYLKNPADVQGTLNKLPFFMDAERKMMQALLRAGPNAHVDALKAVPKNLQLMYLHAFQSLLWNLAASTRIELYGREGVVEGDLVFPKDSAVNDESSLADPEVDLLDAEGGALLSFEDEADEGEEATESRDAKRPKKTPARMPDVHIVTKDDVDKGAFGLTDVVLPMPGFGVTYPANRVRDCYMKALEERGLTEACFSSSSQKAFSLGGMYRRLIQVPKDMSWEVKRYDDNTLHLINTDIDDLLDIEDARTAAEQAEKERLRVDNMEVTNASSGGDEPAGSSPSTSLPATAVTAATAVSESTEEKAASSSTMDVEMTDKVKGRGLKRTGSDGRYTALCLHFTLPPASYATMCVREITKQDTGSNFQSSLNALGPGQHQSVPTPSGDSQGPELAGENEGAPASSPAEVAETDVSPRKGAVIKIGASFSS